MTPGAGLRLRWPVVLHADLSRGTPRSSCGPESNWDCYWLLRDSPLGPSGQRSDLFRICGGQLRPRLKDNAVGSKIHHLVAGLVKSAARTTPTCGQTDPLATANRTRRGEEDHGNSAWAPKTLAVDLLTSLPQDNSSTFEKVLRDSFTSDGSGWISMRAHASWILHFFSFFLQYLLMLMPEAVILFAKFVSALFAGLVSIATIRPFGAETPLFGFNLTSLARCAELFTENASGSFINSFANSPPENLVGHLHAPIRVASSLMTTACLQETYLLEEPCDQEVEKHHRAHHRGYNAPPTREKSRIRRFLLNSSPSRQLAVDDGSDVHTELPIKSSRSFIGYRASTVGDAAGLDAKPPRNWQSPQGPNSLVSNLRKLTLNSRRNLRGIVTDHHILMQYASSILQGSSSPFQLSFSPSRANQHPDSIRRVLDIGCGPAASLEGPVAEKLSFVKHNFLECMLPFDTASFDYVHTSFIASGTPEQKWASLLGEMARVLKRQGTLEILECNTLIADPIKAQAPNPLNDQAKQGGIFRQASMAGAWNASCISVNRESESLRESMLEVAHKVSKGWSTISNVTTSMKRPLAETFIRFPSDLQSFVDTQTKSPDRAATFPEAGTEEVLPSNDRRVKDAADESMGMLLLHSHVDAMYSTKEISWSDLWPPSLHCETTSSNLPSIAPKRTSSRRPTISSRPFQQIRRNRHFSTNTKVKFDCYERSVYEASFDKPVYDESAPMPHEGKLSSYGKLRSMSQLTLNTTIHEGSSSFDLHLDRRDSVQHQCEPEQLIHDSSRDSSGFRASTQRENFDQIWDQWKEDLSCNSLGISKLLELRFGWTCALDIENHQALCEYYEVYQQELTHCETQIHELGGRLQEMKYPRSFEYETSSEDDEDFEHVHFPRYSTDNWRGNSDAGYGGNVPQHESDYQSSEESVLNIRIEDIKVRSHAPHPLEKSGHRSPISQPEERLPDKNGDLVTYIREQVGSENQFEIHKPKEEETDSGVEMEIDNLTRQKDQIKKTIQQIQNDLDNVARRLGLSDPETFQPAILVIIAKHDERHKDNVAFPGALGAFASSQSIENESPKHTHNDSATRISTFNRNTTSSMSDLTSSLCRVAKDLRFTNAGFGDLKIEKFYSIKQN
ncbi:hypothetical protein KEM48_005513 [Puccinia striiformis f. sp. tritici PST-130]|nr:hypothetical protein KEM48_005513 [Puccinia striiformis f. sp. tritici PST-130]